MKAKAIINSAFRQLARGDEFWQDPAGKLHAARPSHVDWALDYMRRHRLVSPKKLDYLDDFATYQAMYRLGWLRIYVDRGDETIWVQAFDSKPIPERQVANLIKYAIQKEYVVKQDTYNISRPARIIYEPPDLEWFPPD